MVITSDVRLAPGQYLLPHGISIGADGVTVDGTDVYLIGNKQKAVGIHVANRRGVTIKGIGLACYRQGIRAENCRDLTISGTTITATEEIESDTIFLDIWLPAAKSYGGAIFLDRVRAAVVAGNNLEHNMCGLLTYQCSKLQVINNKANYCSGYGFHLMGTCDSHFEDNAADYCCRYNVRNKLKGIQRLGHMGADATGFLIIGGSHRNVFRRNFARMGGDGFFLAGLNSGNEPEGANDNLFEENDGSLSPNIAFEATFARGNIFRNNYANNSNYGFWLGFSRENVIEGNRVVGNRQAGIAVENGSAMTVRNNTFQGNGHGILLWSTVCTPRVKKIFPFAVTSHDWQIRDNVFARNTKAIRIAAAQDHGIRDLPKDRKALIKVRPHHHAIIHNNIQENRVGIELDGVDHTEISDNVLHHNPETNIRQDDCTETAISGNIGSVAGYLA